MIPPKLNIQQLQRMKDFGEDRSSFIRLDKNERTTPFSEAVFQGMMSNITPDLLPMYPDQTPLYKKLASFLGIEENCLLLSPGSDAALKIIFETYIAPGDRVIILDPTYAMIDVYATLFQAKKTLIRYAADLTLPFEELVESITPATRAVFIANPNQPTGTILSNDQIVCLLKKTRDTQTLIVFDEAYYPFGGTDSPIRFLNEYPQLMITRSFSKAFGLASVRLGYLVSQSQNIDALYKVKTLADINLLAVKLGEYLIDNYFIVEDYVHSVRKSQQLIRKELSAWDIQCLAGHANFMHLRLPKTYDLKQICEAMKQRGFLIRITGKGLPAVLEGCIRITLGPEEQMQTFVDAFRTTLMEYSPQKVS